ncbi:MAG TPA: beta-N-acetylhexosaminidase [Sphingobacteriaceae bacterium]|nr:beta-N-acetylhexosaminidase [Sphingobacteriaceae bacterium]
MRNLFYCCLLILFSVSAAAQKSILPQPQKITYGSGGLLIKGLTIGFASKPSTEDRFAAKELAKVLSKSSSSSILVKETPVSGPSVILKRTGDVRALPGLKETTGPDSREAYTIKVTPQNITITSPSSAGLFYAVQTIRQMIEGVGSNAVIRTVDIQDWPSLAYRGLMMDMSHMQLPKVEEIKKQLDFLALWKTNQYLFYSEGSIELEGYPLLMADARYSQAQVKDIIAYARERHIDVIPNMELYGHLNDLFRLEKYADMSVTTHGAEFKPADPRVKPLVDDWIVQVSKLFPSPFFHIGFDETWVIDIEAKRTNQPAEQLYLKMLNQTTDMVEKQGKTALVWADMLQKYHTIIPEVSKKMIAVPWHYFPKQEAEYDKLLSPFQKIGVDMFVQSALINWKDLTPSFDISFDNIDVLLKAGRKYNAKGYINSAWTDDPQTLTRLGLPDFAYGSIAAWQPMPMDRPNFFKNYANAQYSPAQAVKVAMAHEEMLKAAVLIRGALGRTNAPFWASPFTPKAQKTIKDNVENLRNGRLASQQAQTHIREALKFGQDTATLYTMLVGAKELDFVALKYMYAGEMKDFYDEFKDGKPRNADNDRDFIRLMGEFVADYHSKAFYMMSDVMEIKEMFRKAYLTEYEPYRLGIAMGKFDYEFQFWLRLQRRLWAARQNYLENGKLPPYESVFLVD